MGLMRIPYTAPLPAPTIVPASASTLPGAITALGRFLRPRNSAAPTLPPPPPPSPPSPSSSSSASPLPNVTDTTTLLTGAGISVASGLADYRGTRGTYTLNKTYRPIYFHEFAASHEARKRYWARSFLGWTNLHRAGPNAAHRAVARLGEMGLVGKVITQNVDSFHPMAHPSLATLELHGYLRSAVCLTCRTEYPREKFQQDLANLNPAWAAFLDEMLSSGALTTENPEERTRRGLKTNPDGDVDIPGVEYGTFRYPPCPKCLAAGQDDHQHQPAGSEERITVKLDRDGAWAPGSNAGILKPAVIMFGESIPQATKLAAEAAIDSAARVLVLGSSLATYSAWRLVKRAKEQGKPVSIVNLGGVRGEDQLLDDLLGRVDHGPEAGVRCAHELEVLLPRLVEALERDGVGAQSISPPLSRSTFNPAFRPAAWA